MQASTHENINKEGDVAMLDTTLDDEHAVSTTRLLPVALSSMFCTPTVVI